MEKEISKKHGCGVPSAIETFAVTCRKVLEYVVGRGETSKSYTANFIHDTKGFVLEIKKRQLHRNILFQKQEK